MINLTVNGQVYQYPEVDDEDWGAQATLWAQAITQGCLQLAGGPFPLTAEVDFGSTYGIRAKRFKSKGSPLPPNTAGVLLLANEEKIAWMDSGNVNATSLRVDSSDHLIFNDGISDKDISALGGGNVDGPGSSTDNALVRWNGNTAINIQDSNVILSDGDSLSGLANVSLSGLLSTATINASGAATVNALTSNTSVNGASATISGLLTANSVVSNTSITGATLNTSGAATVNSLVVNTSANSATLNVSGASVLTGNVSIGNTTPLSAGVQVLGTATLPFKSLNLDNGATDAGAIYFDAGTSAFLKMIAAGTQLQLGGATSLVPSSDGAASLGTTSLRWSKAELKTNIGTSTPDSNALYADLIPKAWAQTNAAGSLLGGVNFTVSKGATGRYDYVFKTAMADANYAVMVTTGDAGSSNHLTADTDNAGNTGFPLTSAGFSVFIHQGFSPFAAVNATHQVVVFGTQ